ncbi:reverse transcriptase domain-containing protein [Lysobacter sp. A289]
MKLVYVKACGACTFELQVDRPVLTLAQLQSAFSHRQLAAHLDMSAAALLEGLYGRRQRCKVFLLPKKSGGYRRIASPRKTCRKIQTAVRPVLEEIYRRPDGAFGFIAGESIVSNAKIHVARRTLINLDLEDFFGSISFYRIRGLFLSQPLGLPWAAANILAHACTYQGRLTAGGITSPVLSNIIAAGLDKRLGRLAGRYGARYSRYVDDITISFAQPASRLAEFAQLDDSEHYVIAPHLAGEITAEGFSVNHAKFRVETGVSRKSVTGLVVNKKVNIPRRWLRRLESKIYAVEKFGVDKVALDMFPEEQVQVGKHKVLRHIHGQSAYLSMVRGRTDWVAAGIAARFNAVAGESGLKVPDIEIITELSRSKFGIWIVAGAATDDLYDPPNGNGSGFTTADGHIITAYHVVFDENDVAFPYISVRRENHPSVLLSCQVVSGCKARDVAILELAQESRAETRVRFTSGKLPDSGVECWTVGYPQYFPGHKAVLQKHVVGGLVIASGVHKIRLLGGSILGGLSGAPAFDAEMRLLGFVHKGLANAGNADELISIRHVNEMISAIT